MPANYDPERSYPLNIYLHGYSDREYGADIEYEWPRQIVANEDSISLIPVAWRNARWWNDSQTQNLNQLRTLIGRTYNLDENRVYMLGISDGGSGAWYQAAVNPTPYAAFVSLIFNPLVLSNPDHMTERDFYPLNLLNSAYLAIIGGRDRVYPAEEIELVLHPFQSLGVNLQYLIEPNATHATDWIVPYLLPLSRFREAQVRNPQPQQIYWRANADGVADRAYWIRIDAVKPVPEGTPLESANPYMVEKGEYLYPRTSMSGRLVAVQNGNTFEISSEGVEKITLLLSPDTIDFSRPVRVIQNDRLVFASRVAVQKEVLLKWAAEDKDSSMLYAAELSILFDTSARTNRAANLSALGASE